MEEFEMERMQSTWENIVDYDMSESGIRAVTLNELMEMGLDLNSVLNTPLGYSQSNGTVELRESLTKAYPGASVDNIEVTNGTSEANYIVALVSLKEGDEMALEIPNYMQLWGVARSLGVKINTFSLDFTKIWEPDWQEFEAAVNEKTRLVYISNPNNPSGAVLSDEAMDRIVRRCEDVGAFLLADEVYIGAELRPERTRTFWGMSDRVIVTSGLSKAFGIPGIRIGWIVGPVDFVGECWAQHDYITIGPNKLSDLVARTAVDPDNREKLYKRTREILKSNYPVVKLWIESFGDFFSYHSPQAGAFCFVKYKPDIPSHEICQAVLKNQSTLIVPGSHLGMEGFLRIWMGAEPEFLNEGLHRIGEEIKNIIK
ncbi:MAG: aminotransferase class I/II-fold pyridoxal phosphate-dependent enzyme [Candidatus Aminicenantes bacterium]|nr:aminotransferase class I/II-fold pyridoxal phosphate-dependent enzyme [Candidatus Aminicenantes bacterium]